MRVIKRRHRPAGSAAVVLTFFAAAFSLLGGLASACAQGGPVVVELFTSQGCSSCPPADSFLQELARRPGVLALGYHVDYWDRLGWRDPFSFPGATERQRSYATRFGRSQVYTPQLVVNGTEEFVGSDRGAVETALVKPRGAAGVRVSFAPDRSSASLLGLGTGSGASSAHGAVLLLRFVQHRTTRIGAGENARRTAEDINAVENLSRIGDWQGDGMQFAVAPPGTGEGIAVLVQGADGRIVGAGAVLGGAGS